MKKFISILLISTIHMTAYADKKKTARTPETTRRPSSIQPGQFFCTNGMWWVLTNDNLAEKVSAYVSENCNTSLPFSTSPFSKANSSILICCTAK